MDDIWYTDQPDYTHPCECGHRRLRKQWVNESVGAKILAHPRFSCERCGWEDKGPQFDAALARYWGRNVPGRTIGVDVGDGLPWYGEPYRNSASEPFVPQPTLVVFDEAETAHPDSFTLSKQWAKRIIVITAPTNCAEFYRTEPEADAPTVVEGYP